MKRHLLKRYILIFLGAAIGIGLSIFLREKHREHQIREKAWKTIAPELEATQDSIVRSANSPLSSVRGFFEDRKKRIPAFAGRALSLRSKWELMRSKVSGGDKDRHAKFLADEFSKTVFSSAELERAVIYAIENYERDIEADENKLLVKVRADLENLPEFSKEFPELRTEQTFHQHFDAALRDVTRKTGVNMNVGLARLVGTEITTAIAVTVVRAAATRLGVSATIEGIGASGSPETLGISIIAGLIIDQLAGWVIDWYYKPEEQITRSLNEELDQLSKLIIEGDDKTLGLKQRLATLAQQRKLAREAALRKLITKR